MSEATTYLELRDLRVSYGKVEALHGISVHVEQGEIVTILGANGAGKTTTLTTISGLRKPSGGSILFQGRPLHTIPSHEIVRLGITQSPEGRRVFGTLSVRENLDLGAFTSKDRGRSAKIRKWIFDLFPRLAEREGQLAGTLSGGEQQMLAIARALMADPKVLLLDEPFSALDYKLRRAMQLEIKRLQRRLGITFVFVTHDQEEAFAMSDRVVVMNQGRIEQIGTPQEIYEEPSNLYVARFVGEINILPARIMSVPGEGIYIADISGRRFTLRTSRSFAAGDRVNVLLRPEDIRVYAHDDERPEGPYLTGRIEETVYKGATVDISIALDSGETLSVAEFFNEDDAEISYNRGERVAVTWVDGWEVVLPYEAD